MPAIDVEAERRQAYSEGHAAATAELTKQIRELRGPDRRAHHQREKEELVAKHAEEMARVIARRLDAIAAEVADLVSAATAKAIAPMLTEAVAAQAVSSCSRRYCVRRFWRACRIG